jgi:hypothetical protein
LLRAPGSTGTFSAAAVVTGYERADTRTLAVNDQPWG